jgi:hypothetical protein
LQHLGEAPRNLSGEKGNGPFDGEGSDPFDVSVISISELADAGAWEKQPVSGRLFVNGHLF